MRIPNVCSADPDKTVLCHLRSIDVAGAALKPNDLVAYLGCSECHAWQEVLRHQEELPAITGYAVYALDAISKTLDYWVTHGILSMNRYGEIRWEES